MGDDTTEGEQDVRTPAEASQRERKELHVSGSMSDRFMSVAGLAKAWMADLWRVGFYAGGRKEAGEVSYPQEQFGGRPMLPVRSRTGQTLFLVLMAYPDDPLRDGRTFMRTEVRGVVPRTSVRSWPPFA